MHPEEVERWKQIHDSASPARPEHEVATQQVLVLTVFTMAVELVAGYWSGSMALVADGWHMSTHAAAMGLAWVAHVACRSRRMRARMTFGTGKISALGGYTSALLLTGIALYAGAQSVSRLFWPVPVAFVPALVVAVGGLGVNLWSARILSRADRAPGASGPAAVEKAPGPGHTHSRDAAEGAHRHDPSHRAAIAHVAADAATSVLAIVALLGGRVFGWAFLDPLTGLVGCALVLYWGLRLVRSSAHTLLDFTPACGVETAVRDLIAREYDAVVVDAHVWEFAPRQLACTVSLIAHEPLEPEHVKATLSSLSELVHVNVEVNPCREDHPPGTPG
jgi:cation diffusion facilitator family transporter